MHEGACRFSVQRCRRIDLLDPAGTQHRDSVRHLHRLRLIVRHEDAGEAHSVVQRAQPHAKAFAHLRIERAEWFVEQQQPGLDRQRAGKCDALTLARRRSVRDSGAPDRQSPSSPTATARARESLAPVGAGCAAERPDRRRRCAAPSYDGTARNAGIRSQRIARAPARPASTVHRRRCRRNRRNPDPPARAATSSCRSPTVPAARGTRRARWSG